MSIKHENSSSCFPLPLVGDEQQVNVNSNSTPTISAPLFATTPSAKNALKLQGKLYKSAINGHLSISSILTNAFQLPGFPRSSYAINQTGKLELTFSRMDTISKRLAVIISSLVILPGSDYQVAKNNDGDSIIIIILDDQEFADEKLLVIIFAILRLGATYMVVTRNELTDDMKYWTELISLIEPIMVITMSHPIDLPTAMKQDLNLIGREQFEDFEENDDPDSISNLSSGDESTTEINPFHTSTLLVKKIRSSLILSPSTYLKPPTIAYKLLWDLAQELYIPNEKDMQLLHFRSEIPTGQRTAFIFQCACASPYPTSVQQWCRLSHKAIRNRISWERIEFPIKASEKLSLTFPLHDPRSLVQIFNCFIHGKTLMLGEPGEFQSEPFLLRKFCSDAFKNVQRIELTTDRLENLLEYATQPKLEFYLGKIKIWIISSSSTNPFTPSLAKRFFQAVKSNDVVLVVTYGTPSCLWCATWNIFSSMKEVNNFIFLEKDGNNKVAAGIPTTNTTVIIVDEQNDLCSVGQKGEICVLGSMIPTGYCGTPLLGRNVTIFQTGDAGKIIQDKTGNLQLIVETQWPEGAEHGRRKMVIKGNLMDLDDISRQVKQNSAHVREAFVFSCQRGRGTPEMVAAVAMKDRGKFGIVQEMISTNMSGLVSPLVLTCFPVASNIPRVLLPGQNDNEKTVGIAGGAVDLKNLRAAYFKYLGKCDPKDWLALIPEKGISKSKTRAEESIEKTIKIICKAVAFSLGVGVSTVIDNFENSFWTFGGTPMKAILTVKSCLCQGKKMGIEDFMMADKISELGFRLVYADKSETKWHHELELVRQFFIYSRLTRSDHLEVDNILSSNISKIFPMTEQKVINKYTTGLIETFDNSLSAVALSSENRELLGISLNYRGNLKQHFVPPKLEEGLELYKVMLQSCRHLTAGIEDKNIAKSFMLSLNNAALVHPSQILLVLRDLVRESMGYAENAGCRGFLVCTQDPLVQEVCCSLLGFEMLTEIQLNLYRNKKFQMPFAHLDDHQIIGVYFAKLSVL